jgi:hypothetical protein
MAAAVTDRNLETNANRRYALKQALRFGPL